MFDSNLNKKDIAPAIVVPRFLNMFSFNFLNSREKIFLFHESYCEVDFWKKKHLILGLKKDGIS